MILVGIACLIGIPIAVYAVQEYLKDFIYRLEGYWWIFVVAVLITLVISLLSVLWQTLRAARTNPATELKKE
jgi:putative ABC transport system permease protein